MENLIVSYEKLNEIVFAGSGPSRKTLYEWIKKGFPVIKIGSKKFYYHVPSVIEYLQKDSKKEKYVIPQRGNKKVNHTSEEEFNKFCESLLQTKKKISEPKGTKK